MNVSARLTRLLPTRRDYAGTAQWWRGDVMAGITVGLVALPLALAFGISAGLSAQAGLVTAIVAGLVAGVLGGSNVQVSGPTGAMAVVLAPIVAQHGTNGVLVAGIMAGVVITLAGVFGLGRYLEFAPWPVIEGFTVGIAVIIFLQQVPAALGVAKPDGEQTAVVAGRSLWRFLHGAGDGRAVLVVVVVAALMLGLPRLHRAIPASLVAVLVATVGVAVLNPDIALIGALPHSLPSPGLPDVNVATVRALLGPALAIALLGSLESLLSAKVADGMVDGPAHQPDRELFGQGLANIISPLFGGMPATGAIARTAVNVRAGARTRVSAIVHSLLLVLIVLFGSGLVSQIPVAALAGVLMVTAARMVERHNVRAVVNATRGDAVVLGATAAFTIAFDLITAVEIGVAIAAGLALRNTARAATVNVEATELSPGEGHRLLHDGIAVYRLDGSLFFGAAQRFLTELTEISDVRVVILRFADMQVLDATGAHALQETIAELEGRGITVLLKGLRPDHLRTLEAVGAIDRLRTERHVFDTLDDAVAHARTHLAPAA